ncbi:hypothetical protein SDC9_122974 [bioreactor metagenome]|uniref:Uncharacterized protein n=1 Tax=bioreactor metagenome TaxID=1076179 RepID=A0A645CG82_9ZZZZ
MDKLMMLSQLMGGNNDPTEMMKMVETAKMIGAAMNTKEEKPIIKMEEVQPKEDEDIRNRQIKAINAALPFLDKEYQKGLFMVIKLMEINRFSPQGSIMAMEKGGDNPQRRRIEMINAFNGFLSVEEQKKLGAFLKMAKAGVFLQD